MNRTPSTPPTADDAPHGAPDPARPLTRRSVVAGAGGVACVGLLAACGGGSTATAPPAPAATPPGAPDTDADTDTDSTADPTADAGDADGLTSTSDVPVGGGVVFADQDVVVTQPTAGQFRAFSATCTHQGCKVNAVRDGVIICPCHNSRFAIADGAVAGGPAKRPLPSRSVTVEGDSIVVA